MSSRLAWAAIFSGTVATLSAQSVSITEYPVVLNNGPSNIAAGGDGALWFTEQALNNIGRIATDGTITVYPVTSGGSPWGIAKGPDGALWFTEGVANRIGRITTSGSITEYSVPTIAAYPSGIAMGPDNALWFTETNSIGRINTTGAITEYALPASSASPSSIAAGPDGALWFTEYGANKIGRMTTAGVVTEYTIPTANSQSLSIVAGPDGALWFAESGKVGRITTAGTITEYPVPSHGYVQSIATGPDGALWFTETLTSIGRITTAGVVTEYPVMPAAGGEPMPITTGPDGALWFGDPSGRIARFLVTSGNVTVTTSPWLQKFTVDGVSYIGSVSFNWAAGESHSIGVATPQYGGAGTRYAFTGWSDAGAQIHNITVPSSASTFTATFATQYRLILGPGISANPPSADGYYNSGTSVQLTAAVPPGVSFSGWSGSLTATADPLTLTMSAPLMLQANFTGPSLSMSVSEYPLPGTSSAGQIAKGSDGELWFTEATPNIGRINLSGPITEYPVPNAGTSIAGGPDGALWFTEAGGIGRITTNGSVTGYPITSGATPASITMGPDNNMWFVESSGKIAQIGMQGYIREFAIPTPESGPAAIAMGPDNALWFTEANTGKIGRITASGAFTEYPLPAWGSSPGAIAAGPDGALWFIESQNIGRITTAGVITEYPLPWYIMKPGSLVNGPDGAMWFNENTGIPENENTGLGRITTGGLITEYPIPASRGSGSLVTGPDGALWFTESYPSKIARALITSGNVMVNTTQTLRTFTVDGLSYAGSVSFNWAAGETHSIGVPSPQPGATGTRYVFAGWSDGGALAHNITVPSTPAVYTAAMTPQCLLTTTVAPSAAGYITFNPASPDGYYNAGTSVQLTAMDYSLFQFSNWSSDMAGAANPQSLVMNAPHSVQANFSGATQQFSFSEYPVHGPNSPIFPISITTGPDGALWFTEFNARKVGRVSTAGVITEYSTSGGLSTQNITTGPDGAMWFTEDPLGNKIGRITMDGALTEYPLPASLTGSEGIAAGPDGALWFTEPNANKIGRITTAGAITEYPVPTAGSRPSGITIGPDGALWFTEYNVSQIGRITTAGAITEYFIPTRGGEPTDIVLGPDGALWFVELETNNIGRITTAGTIREYALPTPASYPQGIAAGPDGALWFTEQTGAKIGRITTAGAITEYSIPSSSSPMGIAAGPDGAIWFTEHSSSIGRMTLATGSCLYSLDDTSQAFPSGGGIGTTLVRAPAGGPGGCSWTAVSTVPWVTITSGGSGGAGNGFMNYTVAPNPSTEPRSGTITVAYQTLAIRQSGTADTLTCTGSVPSVAQVALEGRTEVLGDYLLTCSGLTGTIQTDITLTLNTNVTNALANGATDAVLTVNGGSPQNGVLAGYNSLTWAGLAIAPSGNGVAAVRVSKVRADATLLLTQGAAANPGNPQPTAITGQVMVGSEAEVPVSGALQTMANTGPTLVFTGNPAVAGTGAGQTLIPLVFQEAAAAAFQANATRLRMVLTNVPATVQVYAPVYPNEGPSRAQLYSADSSGSGGSPVAGSAFAGGTYQLLTVTGGAATATWLVTAADATKVETLTLPLLVVNAAAGDLSQMQVSGSLAPVSDVGVASATAPVPRYRDFSAPQRLTNLRVGTSVTAGDPAPAVKAPGPVTPGSHVTFTTSVENDVSDPSQTATNVVVRDILPSGLNPVSCTATGGENCSASGNQYQVNYGTLGPHQGGTVTIVAQVDPSFTGTVIENPASAASDAVNLDLLASRSSSSFLLLTGTPSVGGGSPPSGSASSQSFTFQFSHPAGYQYLGVVNVLINSSLDGRHACYLAYSVPSSTLYLVDDGGDAGGPYAGSVVLGNSSTIRNSQCTVGLTSAVGNGTTLSLTLNIAFQPGFCGDKITYVAARDLGTGNSNWQAMGVWQVPSTTPPAGTIAVTGTIPARGTGLSGQFTFTLTDSKGAGDLGIVNVLVNGSLDGRQACYLAYAVSTRTLYLVDDAGDGGSSFAGTMALNGSPGSIQNSQCQVGVTGPAVTASGNTLTLALNITFKAAFAGNRVIYVAGRDTADGNNTGWQAMGTWSVQ
ncbi:exported hypothetical protein [Candidatus Sulfopaludibacter sp. SbA4]|nr:exported hypothetical protein [Candidatus Sulfopaludibacter sp. SbA4]